jgi:PAS domain S-box-containing protein
MDAGIDAERLSPSRRSWLEGRRGLFSFGCLIFGLTWFGAAIVAGSGKDLAAVWPVNAVTLAVLLRSPPRRWLNLLLVAIFAGAAAGSSLLSVTNWTAEMGLAICDALECLVAASALLWLIGSDIDLSRRRQLIIFGGVSLAACIVSGLPASLVLWLSYGLSATSSLRGWAIGDALGLLIVTPALLAIRSGELRALFSGKSRWRTLSILGGEVIAISAASWFDDPLLKALIFVALMAPALELDMTGAAVGVLAGAATMVGFAAASPKLAHATPEAIEQSHRALQTFLVVAAVVTLGVAATLADRRRLRALMREADHRFQMLTENAGDIVAECDLNGRFTYLSPAVETLTGFCVADLIGQRAVDFVHPEDRARVDLEIRASIISKAGQRIEYRHIRKDGQIIWMQTQPRLATDPTSGQAIAITDVMRDITERRAMEEELERRRAEAEAAAVAKTEFVANMSHEIRTPLTAIIGFTGLLKDIEGLPIVATKYVDRIATAGRSLLSVVNDVLDFSKIDSGQLSLDPQPFEPGPFILETLDLAGAQATAKGLTLSADIDPALPLAVYADSSRLRQVLLNLIGNAIKFTDKGGVTVSASPLAGDPTRLRLAVSDTGAGIAKDKISRLFQRFSQVDGTISRTHGGTGLGLAICKSLTEMMGGDIGVESTVGAGTTFWFTILAPEVELEAPKASGAQALQGCESARILIVDDVAANRELVCAMLSVFDHDMTEAASGQEAVEAALRQPFDLILMDLQMPGMDGMAASRAIRATSDVNRLTPIVALSANAMASHIAECAEAGMNDHIAKPIDATTLLTKVAQWTSLDAEDEGPEFAPCAFAASA